MRQCAFLLGILLVTGPLEAGVRPLTLAELCASSTRIVVGNVTAVQCRWQGTIIVTDITVAPIENLKGAGTDPVTFTIPGGTLGGATLRVSETPKFAMGEQVVVFLRPGVAPCDVFGWHQGKFTLEQGNVREVPGLSWETFRGQILTALAQPR